MYALFKSKKSQCSFYSIAPAVSDELKKQLKTYEPLDALEFNTTGEKRLARIVHLNVLRRYTVGMRYIASEDDIIEACNTLLSELFDRVFFLTGINQMQAMMEAYPIGLLCEICHVNFEQVLLLGEGMKYFIMFRTFAPAWLPRAFQDILCSNIPVAGDVKSPLTEIELQALFRYLGTRKRIYVEILLGCLFELGRHEKEMTFGSLKEDEIIRVYNSSWFYLLCFSLPRLQTPGAKEEGNEVIHNSLNELYNNLNTTENSYDIEVIEPTLY